jgi:hypothetical protein
MWQDEQGGCRPVNSGAGPCVRSSLAVRTVGEQLRPMRRIAILFAALSTGCFSYIPARPGEVEAGVDVRARISPDASARIAPLLGAADARRLDGKLIELGGDTLIVEVPTVMLSNSEFGRTPNQRVSIARSDLVELEVRKLDRARTVGVVGGGALVLGVTLINALKGEPGKEPLPGGGGTDAIVFRIAWP